MDPVTKPLIGQTNAQGLVPPIVHDHDHAASQATFMEITFAISIAFAAFAKVRDNLRDRLKRVIEATTASIGAAEANNPEHARRVENLKQEANTFASAHQLWQDRLCRIAIALSFIMALGCLAILYFDLMERMGHWIGILILPLPIYLVSAAFVSYIYSRRMNSLRNEYVKFVIKFENPINEIKEVLMSLQGGPKKDK